MCAADARTDLRQAQNTSGIGDIRVWCEEAGCNPSQQLVEMMGEFGCRGRKPGIEFDAHGLRASQWRQLEAEISGFCDFEDASELVTRHRVINSDSENDTRTHSTRR